MEDRQKIQYDIIGIHKVESGVCVFMSVIVKSETVRHRLKYNAFFSNYYFKERRLDIWILWPPKVVKIATSQMRVSQWIIILLWCLQLTVIEPLQFRFIWVGWLIKKHPHHPSHKEWSDWNQDLHRHVIGTQDYLTWNF